MTQVTSKKQYVVYRQGVGEHATPRFAQEMNL